MKQKSLRMGYDVTLEKGNTWKPLKVQYWNKEGPHPDFKPSEPFKYMADALLGLSMVKLNHYLKSPLTKPSVDYSFAMEAWNSLDPHIELFERSSPRIRALQTQIAVVPPLWCEEFENHFNEHLDLAIKPWGIDIAALGPLVEAFSWFESKINSPLLYNFGISFSKPFMEKLHTLFSFLYHVRSLVAVDHNAYVEDPSHEGVRVDAISDYLPKAEYVVNDALLYWSFNKFSQSYIRQGVGDAKFDKHLTNPMLTAFRQYSHHACHLVDNLPKSFISSLNPIELEEALYLVQMDWLLGSPAGLLFKIREELYAVQSGYEKIFWKDVDPPHYHKPVALHVCCELKEDHLFEKKSA